MDDASALPAATAGAGPYGGGSGYVIISVNIRLEDKQPLSFCLTTKHRQRKRWEDNIKEWTGLEWTVILRKAVNREEWRKLVVKSTVVPQRSARLWDRGFFDSLILYSEDDGFRPWPNLPTGPR